MAHKYRPNDYVWFGDIFLCQVKEVWSATEYFISNVTHDGALGSGKFPVSEDEIKPATENEVQEYLGNEEDDLS